jgi:hypothetical protein
MAIIAKQAPGRTPAPEGNHLAVCYSMIELGTREEEIEGKKKKRHKVLLNWELTDERTEDDEIVTISKEYTLSMSEKSNLRKDLTSWRGKAFEPEQAREFDITVLLGVPCMLNVIHCVAKSSGNIYDKISSIGSLPKSIPKPVQINDNYEFCLDPFDQEKFDKLPDFITDKIKKSDQYFELTANKADSVVANGDNKPPKEPPF